MEKGMIPLYVSKMELSNFKYLASKEWKGTTTRGAFYQYIMDHHQPDHFSIIHVLVHQSIMVNLTSPMKTELPDSRLLQLMHFCQQAL